MVDSIGWLIKLFSYPWMPIFRWLLIILKSTIETSNLLTTTMISNTKSTAKQQKLSEIQNQLSKLSVTPQCLRHTVPNWNQMDTRRQYVGKKKLPDRLRKATRLRETLVMPSCSHRIIIRWQGDWTTMWTKTVEFE